MRLIEDKLSPEKDYRELFTVEVDVNKCTDVIVGIKNDGAFLYIKEKLANSGNAYWMDRSIYSMDKDEFQHYLEIAKSNGEIAKAIDKGKITLEELEQLDESVI